MKSFKEFIKSEKIETDKDGTPILNTVFGQHSKKSKVETDKDGTPILNTVFGKHSINENIDKLGKELEKHYRFSHKKDLDAIRDYTYTSYPVNSHLHRKTTWKLRPLEKDHELVKPMDEALNRHKTPKELTVYSGVRRSPEHAIKHAGDEKHGVLTKTSNYTSASLDPNTAAQFTDHDTKSKYNEKFGNFVGHMLKIHVPKGHPGAYVDHHSSHKGEKEFILPHNTRMHIHPNPEYDKETGNMIWNAHVLPHKGKE